MQHWADGTDAQLRLTDEEKHIKWQNTLKQKQVENYKQERMVLNGDSQTKRANSSIYSAFYYLLLFTSQMINPFVYYM